MSRGATALVFAATALAVYAAGVVALLAATFATGGGISCDGDACVPVARAADHIAPWGMIGWICVSLAVAAAAARHVRTRRTP